MSYDVHLEFLDPESNQAISVGSLDANHTSNTGGMISEACGGKPFREWDGLKAQEVAALCVRAIRELDSLPDYYGRHEPKNGWGSLGTTVKFLAEIRDQCVLAPTATFRVSA